MTGSDVAGESGEVCVGQCGRVSISFKAHLTVVCPALCVTYTFQKSVLISHLSLTQAPAPGDSAGDPLPWCPRLLRAAFSLLPQEPSSFVSTANYRL